MQITLYKFTKKPNSTKQPTGGLTITGQLKDETSFLNPVIQFSPVVLSGGTFTPNLYNYAQIILWQRYYYITDWKYCNGVWECSMTVDVLASFRSEIGDTNTYIIRSASQYNGRIVDSFYPTTCVCNIIKQSLTSEIYHTTVNNGTFVLGVINNSTSTNKMGAIIYYALTSTQMKTLLEYMFSDNIYNASNINDISEGLYFSLFNPFQYIISCMWFPWPPSAFGTVTETLNIGYWSSNVGDAVIVNQIVKEIGFHSVTHIAQHPQSARGEYLNHAPYTRLTLYYPPFGEIPIDTNFVQFGSNSYVYGKIFIDHVTGIADLYVTITDGYDIQTTADPFRYATMRTAQIGVPIQLSQVQSDYYSSLAGVAGAFGAGASGNIGGIFSNIFSSIQSIMPKVSNLGANGSMVEIIEPPYLIVEQQQMVDENLSEFGRPLCATRSINQLSGYIKCGEADHQFSGTKAESDEINRFMKEGFFYE